MRVRASAVAALVGLASVGLPSAALACGGFFCAQVPVDQSGENIVFGIRGNRVEAHVQIQYQGAAEDFAWVVPLHARPELAIGTPALFTSLLAQTAPQFRLQWESQCRSGWPIFGAPESAADGAAPPPQSPGGGVTVVSREAVGPYDSVILQADDAAALKTWLVDNGYNLTAVGEQLLTPYVGQGYYFVALKLLKDKDVGDLRPVVLTTEGTTPCIPIRLTAVAAQPDMPIRAFVLSDTRAIPQNYRHVLVNPTRLDWMRGGANYPQVASAAVDEAGGRAFLTEFAGDSRPFAESFSVPASWDTAALSQRTHPVDFVEGIMQQGFPADSTLLSLMRQYVPMPQVLVDRGMDEQSFYNSIGSFRSEIDGDPGRAPFDAAGFAAALEETVVVPMKRADALLDAYPYLTRLYTTMSAEEMTLDPEFDFNPDAPTVSNVFTARAWEESCEEDFSKRRVRVELPDGTFFHVTRGAGAFPEGPSALRIEQYGTRGAPEVIADNASLVMGAVRAAGGGVAGQGCGGCGATGAASTLAGLLAGASFLRRRRR